MTSKRVALVTGSASGMGLDIAQTLVKRGWNVAMVDMNAPLLEKVAKELGDDVIYRKTNVTDFKDLNKAFQMAFDKWGRFDYAIANAGIVDRMDYYEPAEVESDGLFKVPDKLVVDVCLMGVVWTAYLAAQYFIKQAGKGNAPKGLIGMTASTSGLWNSPNIPLYSAAKAGVINFARAISERYQGSGIRVLCVCPGHVQTPLVPKSWATTMPDTVTPKSTITTAYMNHIDDESSNGKTVEASVDNHYLHHPPAFTNDAIKKIYTTNLPLPFSK